MKILIYLAGILILMTTNAFAIPLVAEIPKTSTMFLLSAGVVGFLVVRRKQRIERMILMKAFSNIIISSVVFLLVMLSSLGAKYESAAQDSIVAKIFIAVEPSREVMYLLYFSLIFCVAYYFIKLIAKRQFILKSIILAMICILRFSFYGPPPWGLGKPCGGNSCLQCL